MFPTSEYYIDHIHTKRCNPVAVHTDIQDIIDKNIKNLFHLIKQGKEVAFPDVKKVEEIILLESTKDYVATTKE